MKSHNAGLKITVRRKDDVLPKSRIVLQNTKRAGHSVLPKKYLLELSILPDHAFVLQKIVDLVGGVGDLSDDVSLRFAKQDIFVKFFLLA